LIIKAYILVTSSDYEAQALFMTLEVYVNMQQKRQKTGSTNFNKFKPQI